MHRHATGRHGAIAPWIKRVSPGQHLAQDANGEQGFFRRRSHDTLLGISIPTGSMAHSTAPIAGVAIVAHRRVHRWAVAGITTSVARARPAGPTIASAVSRATVTRALPTAPTAAARPSGRAQYGIPHGLYTMFTQAGCGFFVLLDQQFAEQIAHVLHPDLAHLGRHSRFAHDLLQCPDVTFGAQRIALGLYAAQPLGGTHQRVEFCQHRIGGMQGRLLGFGKLHLGLHLALIHKGEFAKVHAGVIGRPPFGDSGPLRKDLQQCHGVALDQRCLVLIKKTQAVADQVALLDIAVAGLFLRQGTLRDLDQLPHQRLAATHGVDNTGAENGFRTGRCLGHGGIGRKKIPAAMLLDLAPYLSALKRIRLGLAPSSPRRFFLSASYSW
ncbi:hypothetical protein D3C72_1208810 [compost metagenome]